MMDKMESIQSILDGLHAHAEQSGDDALQEHIRQLEASLASTGGSISVEDIFGSTAVAVGSDIRIILHQTTNLPDELLKSLMTLVDDLNQRADASPHASDHIRVFLASPGDVKDERQLVLKAIRKIRVNPFYKNLTIEAVAWDKPDDSTPLLAGIDPQQAVREGLGQPSECDICVVIFWSRMGTPLDHAKYQKADGSQYLSGTEWELENALEGFQKNGRPRTLIYRRTEKILLDPDAPDFEEKAHQWGLVRDFFANAHNPDGSIRLSYNSYASPAEFGELIELHLRKQIALVAEEPRTSVEPEPEKGIQALDWPKGKSPFPGLRALGPEDALIFFGRGVETDHLLQRLSDENCRYLAVVGTSGSGKSSLVGAGLLPRLAEGALKGSENWPVATFTPDAWGDGDPFNALTWVLSQPPFSLDTQKTNTRLREKPAGLRQLLEEHLGDAPDWKRVVLFIDQFEELFTRVTDEGLCHAFSLMLSETANSPRVLTVVTMRDDFYHYCVKSPVLSRLINRNTDSTFALSAPGLLELHEMITGPARVARLSFDPGLVNRILEDTGRDPGALALLAYTLDQLYKASDGDNRLTMGVYKEFGGVQGVIGTRAQETYDGLSERAQDALPQVFRELLDVDESGTTTRKRASLEYIESDQACRDLVRALIDARLLVTSWGAGDQALVEVAHEALFHNWPALKAWIEESQDDLILLRQVRTAAALWERNKQKPAYLWPVERLQPFFEMQKRIKPNLDKAVQNFIYSDYDLIRNLNEIDDPITSHHRRSAIGEGLNELGDPRPGVGLVRGTLPLRRVEAETNAPDTLDRGEMRLWGDQPEHERLPDIVWLSVDGGSIKIKKHTYTVQPFYIAKYPVTYLQFQSFIDAKDGFYIPRWWEGLSANKGHLEEPGEQRFKFDNHPRESISWYDAIAFCRWLNAKLNWQDIPIDLSLKTLRNYNGLRLPTEWEWQWMATGGLQENEYPWGIEWDSNKTNTSESGLGRSTAVGMYPTGKAGCGALDISGNIWEWCLNEYRKPEKIELSGDAVRVLRGGSWDLDQVAARVSSRDWFNPDARLNNYGFRVVIRPPSL